MSRTSKPRLGRGAVAGFCMPVALLAWAALYLVGVIDVPGRGWIGALLIVVAVISAVLHALRLRRASLERGQL